MNGEYGQARRPAPPVVERAKTAGRAARRYQSVK